MSDVNMKVNLLGANRGTLQDGGTYSSCFIGEPAEESDDRRGLSVMKVACEYAFLDELRGTTLPAELDVIARVQTAAGGKAGLRFLRLAKKGA